MPRGGPRVPRPDTPDVNSAKEIVHDQLYQFLDEWYYRILSSSIHVTRWEALSILLDVLEMVGVNFAAGEKEMLSSLDQEEGTIARIVDCMPEKLLAKWDQVMLYLQTAVHATTCVRKAAEVKGIEADETVAGVFEENADDSVLQHILKNAVVFSAEKVTRLRYVHSTWRRSTEARIDRMRWLQEDAERSCQELLKLEAQLKDLSASNKSSGKSMLMKLANGNDSALRSAVFSSWGSLVLKARGEKDIRKTFQDRITAADSKFFKFREKQMESVRSVMRRLCLGENEAALRDAWHSWTTEVRSRKGNGDSADDLKKAQARLAAFNESAQINAKKAMARIAGNSEGALKAMSFQGWLEARRVMKQDREMEEAVKLTEQKLKKHMNSKKLERRQIMERMTGSTDSGLKLLYFRHWIDFEKEEKKAREMDEATEGQDRRFDMLNTRQKNGTMNIQSRVNEQAIFNITFRFFSSWLLETKVNNLMRIFHHKYTTKKKQLQGVQNLFKSFAVQLEQNLGGVENDEDVSARIPIQHQQAMHQQAMHQQQQQQAMQQNYDQSYRSAGQSTRSGMQKLSKHQQQHQQQYQQQHQHQHRGMARDSANSVSLPDIHSRHLLA